MPKLTNAELKEKLTAFVGDRTDDEALSILEDVADTLTDEAEDWHAKYNQLDADWRKRYRDRFNGLTEEAQEEQEEEQENIESLSISDVLKAN